MPDQRTEQNHIDTPADTMGASLTSDFSRSEAPLKDAPEAANEAADEIKASRKNGEPNRKKTFAEGH